MSIEEVVREKAPYMIKKGGENKMLPVESIQIVVAEVCKIVQSIYKIWQEVKKVM